MAYIQAWQLSSHRDGNRLKLKQARRGVVAFDFSDDVNVEPFGKRTRNIVAGQVKIIIIHITEMKIRATSASYIPSKNQIVESCLVRTVRQYRCRIAVEFDIAPLVLVCKALDGLIRISTRKYLGEFLVVSSLFPAELEDSEESSSASSVSAFDFSWVAESLSSDDDSSLVEYE